jgi:hypothetical protein
MDNMKELGIDISEVRSFVMQLEQKQDGIDNLVKLNRNFPAFKKLISEKYLAKTLTAPLLLNAWEGFSSNINTLTGLKSVSNDATNKYSSGTDNYNKIPTDNDLERIKILLDSINSFPLLTFTNNFITNTINNIADASKLLLTDTTIGKIDNLTPLEKSKISKIAEDILVIYKLPPKDDFLKIESEIKTLIQPSILIDDTNSVRISDELSKQITIFNRMLGQISNPNISKRLTEYNNYTNNIITGLYSEIGREAGTEDFYTSKTKIKDNISGITRPDFPNLENKIEMINFIIRQRLYTNQDIFNLQTVDVFEEQRLEELSIKLKKMVI